ncbi:hypothetical protein HUT18_15775 [Streptomyces sp. NA04227]|uniref:hypothetical protein n=1 Tax=Streptomyces sp. NA04227 TaxID=2742136 RepID=UPI001590079F|nr:hypothetical protein [Streptomyces sp. NA04227]QKW10923.1 hypothetical protein HUT18_15775 [Streptomyces sp. NA04227]
METVSAISRLTLFPLEELTVAFTTRSSDSRGLGDIAIVCVAEPSTVPGDRLWQLAATMYANTPTSNTLARWILTQCSRARMCRSAQHLDLPHTKWTAELTRTVHLDALFANHEALRTGRMTVH